MSFRPCGRQLAVVLVATVSMAIPLGLFAGLANFGNQVGGISIDAAGVVREPSIEAKESLLKELLKTVKGATPEMNLPCEIRKVSLKGLLAAVEDAYRNHQGQLPDEVKFLAGLQRIEYILVYPEENDIVLAGPGEGWKIDSDANVVGITTGRPVLRFDDLLVAFRTVESARTVGISCSIDPTKDGIRNLQQVLSQIRRSRINPRAVEAKMRQAFGAQQITLSGVPVNSHFARVLVAADYRMKRIAMELSPSNVRKLPSYVSLLAKSRESKANPRWWLACNYEPVAKSEDGLVWKIRGAGVKTMTEDENINAAGERTVTGKTSPSAAKWAELMTDNYDELSGVDKVFGKLRNLMDLCVVAAIIERHGLRDAAGCDLGLLYDDSSVVEVEEWNAAKTVAPQFSFIQSRSGMIVTASGGVQVESWEIADRTETVAQIVQLHASSKSTTKRWWWN
jgi:hypothetical protein